MHPPSKRFSWVMFSCSIFMILYGYDVLAAPKLEEKLLALSSVQTLFRHETNRGRAHHGELWIERPNKFRLQTNTPWKQTLVSNGKRFWNFDSDLEQVTVDWLEQDIGKYPILLFTGPVEDLRNFYNISNYSDKGFSEYHLTPKTQGQYVKSMRFIFRGLLPVRIVIIDVMDEHSEFSFNSTQVNSDLPDELFEFLPPPDIEVLDRTKTTWSP